MQYDQMGDDMISERGLTIRDAGAGDAAELAAFAVMAGHGIMELYYEGLVPGRSVIESIIDRRINLEGGFNHWCRWKVVCNVNGRVLGGMNCFPHAMFDKSPSDPLLAGPRLAPTQNLWDLEQHALGSFCLNMIAVHSEARGSGVGNLLMAECLQLAEESGLPRVTLSTFEEDRGLMAFYGRHGFEVLARAPIPADCGIAYTGNWVLLAREVACGG
jgi:GNAT superfamily N-acetyltransferase